MMNKTYRLLYSPLAKKDAKKIAKSCLREKCQELLDLIAINPYTIPPSYEKLKGDLSGYVS